MKYILLILLMVSNLSAQNITKPFTSTDCVVVLGQSNADYFANYEGPLGDSISGGSKLSYLLKTLWSRDTVPYMVFGRGATFLYNVHPTINWNISQDRGYFDSIPLLLNGILTYPTLSYSTGTNFAIGYYRHFNNIALNIRAVIWLQGENDSQNLTYSNAYQANLTAFIASLRSQLQKPTLPFIMVKLGDAYTGTYKTTINTAYDNIALADPNTGTINTSDFTGGTYYIPPSPYVHYNTKGSNLLATRIITLITSKGW